MAFTNSKLATYQNVSPNRNTPRNHRIDTITIHCMATQWTAKQCCDYFAKSSSKASSNYCVGKDGSIGLSVPESDRSWCSSSASNDNRAITIEVASDSSAPYKVTVKAYNALIDLLVDICERNNIRELKWKADKSLIGEVGEQNMTVHRWFANKACPGAYLYNRHSQIAKEVNERLSENSGGSEIVSNDGEFIWNYLMNEIGNEYGVAGLMGNLFAESGLRSNNLQNSYETILGYTDEEYTNAVDNGEITKSQFISSSHGGYGLAQWTFPSRKQALYEMYKEGEYESIGSVELACDYLIYELDNDFPNVLWALIDTKNIREASDIVLHDFESPANQSESVELERYTYAMEIYSKFANGGSGDSGEDWEGITHRNNFKLLMMALATENF